MNAEALDTLIRFFVTVVAYTLVGGGFVVGFFMLFIKGREWYRVIRLYEKHRKSEHLTVMSIVAKQKDPVDDDFLIRIQK